MLESSKRCKSSPEKQRPRRIVNRDYATNLLSYGLQIHRLYKPTLSNLHRNTVHWPDTVNGVQCPVEAYAVAIQCFNVVHLKSIKAYNNLRTLCMLLSIQIIEVLVLESLKSSGHMPQVDHGKLFCFFFFLRPPEGLVATPPADKSILDSTASCTVWLDCTKLWLGHRILGKLMQIVKGKWFYHVLCGFPTPPPFLWYYVRFGGNIFLFTVMHPIPICQIYIKWPHFERTVKSFAQILCFPNLPWTSSSKWLVVKVFHSGELVNNFMDTSCQHLSAIWL